MSKGERTRERILRSAMKLSERDGYQNITREGVAGHVGCAPGLINRYFDHMSGLKRAVVRQAVKDENLKILLQAIVAKDRGVRKLPAGLRERARASLV